MIKSDLSRIQGYIGIANKANYVIFGADNLKGYSHKLFLVLYREDCGKTISKVVEELKKREIPNYVFSVEEFNSISNLENCKLLAIKNKGLSQKIIEIIDKV